ncbi:MAG: histidine kinase [Chloroflexi bacterium]|nr:histidine kinase [Chloroflexota bacterium]
MLLRFPVFHKILLANFAITVLSAFLGAQAGAHLSGPAGNADWTHFVGFIFVGAVLSLVANALVVKVALSPVAKLQAAAGKVIQGDLSTVVPKSVLADSSIGHLVEVFNSMLESVRVDRQQLEVLSGQILQAQEEERKRIARELHDETAQALTALLVRLRLLSNASTLEEAKGRVAELREVTARTLEEVRRLALELRSAVLDDLGLVAALEIYVDDYNKLGNATTRLHCRGVQQRLSPETELALYRVVQESLTNAARHSKATSVDVSLEREGAWVNLTVEDNGIGFDVERALSGRNVGLGVFGMRERIVLLGGDFLVESIPGSFTRVKARVPALAKSLSG